MTRTSRPSSTMVSPTGLANFWTCWAASESGMSLFRDVKSAMVKSWTRAIPALAKARLVRTYARNVRSDARWSRATLPEFSRTNWGWNICRLRNFFVTDALCRAPEDEVPIAGGVTVFWWWVSGWWSSDEGGGGGSEFVDCIYLFTSSSPIQPWLPGYFSGVIALLFPFSDTWDLGVESTGLAWGTSRRSCDTGDLLNSRLRRNLDIQESFYR